MNRVTQSRLLFRECLIPIPASMRGSIMLCHCTERGEDIFGLVSIDKFYQSRTMTFCCAACNGNFISLPIASDPVEFDFTQECDHRVDVHRLVYEKDEMMFRLVCPDCGTLRMEFKPLGVLDN